jgi:hypothetical protein
MVDSDDFEWSERGEELRIVLITELYLTIGGQGKTLLPNLEIIIGKERETWKISAVPIGSPRFSDYGARHKKLRFVRNPGLSHCRVEGKHRRLEFLDYKGAYSEPIADAKRAASIAAEEAETVIKRFTLRQK